MLLLSWTYGTSVYDRKLISDDVEYMHNYKVPYVGCPWTNLENVQLWTDSLVASRAAYGKQSTAQGMVCTNWGGGRIEAGMGPMAKRAWNLATPAEPTNVTDAHAPLSRLMAASAPVLEGL